MIYNESTPQVLQRGIATVSSLRLYDAKGKTVQVATGGTYSLALGDRVLASGAIAALTGYTASRSVTVASTEALGGGYVETWTLTGVDSPIVREVHVCLTQFRGVVVEADLSPTMRRTFVGNLQTDLQWYFDQSWEMLWRKIAAQGRYPYLVMDPYQFKDAQLALVHSLLYADGAIGNPAQSAGFLAAADRAQEEYMQALRDVVWNEASSEGDTIGEKATALQPGLASSTVSRRWAR